LHRPVESAGHIGPSSVGVSAEENDRDWPPWELQAEDRDAAMPETIFVGPRLNLRNHRAERDTIGLHALSKSFFRISEEEANLLQQSGLNVSTSSLLRTSARAFIIFSQSRMLIWVNA
jgi:hypothetical protein